MASTSVRPLAIAAAVTLLVINAGSAQNAAGRRVLVVPFAVQADPPTPVNAAGSAWLGEAAAISIVDQLQALGFPSFTREERVAAFDKLELPLTGNLTRATTIRAAELIGASHLVMGEVRAGSSISLHARLIRLDAGQQLTDVELEGTPIQLFAVADRVASALARSVDGLCRDAACTPRIVGIVRPELDVFENYVKGLLALAPVSQQRFLEVALRKAPRDARVLLALWNVYSEQGSHAKALVTARTVPADSPLQRQARFCAPLSLIQLGRLDEAARDLLALQQERPSPVLANALGIVLLRRSRPGADAAASASPESPLPVRLTDTAATFFFRAVQAAPEDTDYLFNLGYAHALAHDAPAALQWLREAVRFDATNGDAHLVMSAVLESTGKTVEAKRELDLARLLGARRAATATPASIPIGLERLRTDLDSPVASAAAIGRPAERDQREVASFHLQEGRRLLAAQKDREASDELRRAIYLSPYEDEPHLLLGRIYERAGRLSDAIDEFKVALWCRESFDARLALATALLASGDKNGARTEAQRALAMRPDSAEAKALLAKIDG